MGWRHVTRIAAVAAMVITLSGCIGTVAPPELLVNVKDFRYQPERIVVPVGQTVRLKLTGSAARRFPQIAVAETLPPDDPARRGQALFVSTCFACHKMNGAGDATIGPDLNLPMNPTEYFQPAVLPRYLRNPASVRHWADQKMPAIAPETMSDADLAAIIAYLGHMAGRKK